MKQLIPKCVYNVGFGSTTGYFGVTGGLGDFAQSVTFGATYGRHPVSAAGTFRSLVVYSRATHASTTVTVLKNGIATALVVTLGSGSTIASNITDEVTFVQGDDISYKVVTTQGAGFDLAFCGEWESTVNIYGITPWFGGLGLGASKYGGGLGNGEWMDDGGGAYSNSYSINAVAGSITGITITEYAGAPGIGIWTARIKKNSILQDGSGGTVDTAVVLTGASTTASGAFTLPIAIQDKIDIELTRTGAVAGGGTNHVGACLSLVPTTGGQYMCCGGSNDSISASASGWRWNRSEQLATPETRNLAPIGPLGCAALGLYVERGAAPAAGKSDTYTLRKTEADTALTLSIADLATTGTVTGTVNYASGDTIDLQIAPSGTPTAAQLHWGLGLTSIGSLTILKVTSPSPDPTDADFTFTVDPDITSGPFLLKDGESNVLTGVAADDYTIVETVPSSFWTQQSSMTVDGGIPEIFINPLVLSAGHDYVVTFTNTYAVPVPPTEVVVDRRLRRAPHLNTEQRWNFYTYFQLDMQVGVGLTDGQGSDPEIELRYSDTGGATWSRVHKIKIGKLGQYRHRVIWRRLGRSRDRVFEVAYSEPTKFSMLDAFLGIEPGTN